MYIDEENEMNSLVLHHLRLRGGKPLFSLPDEHEDPYFKAGSHPDVVSYLWDTLGAGLSVDCRALIYGRPALVFPETGVIFGLAYGTQYAIRIPSDQIDEALELGCKIEQEWSGGSKTKIEKTLGRGWVFGCGLEQEKEWLKSLLQTFESVTKHRKNRTDNN